MRAMAAQSPNSRDQTSPSLELDDLRTPANLRAFSPRSALNAWRYAPRALA